MVCLLVVLHPSPSVAYRSSLSRSAASLGLTGQETFTIEGIAAGDRVPRELTVKADDKSFTVTVRIDTPGEQAYYRNGGIMPFVLRSLL